MIEVIFKIFLTDYIDFQRFITKRIQKPLLIEYMIDLWYQSPKIDAYAVVHSYFNKDSYFPGLEAGMVDYKLWNDKIAVSPSAALWLQPKNLSFTEKRANWVACCASKHEPIQERYFALT
jgi:hypothetical protein